MAVLLARGYRYRGLYLADVEHSTPDLVWMFCGGTLDGQDDAGVVECFWSSFYELPLELRPSRDVQVVAPDGRVLLTLWPKYRPWG